MFKTTITMMVFAFTVSGCISLPYPDAGFPDPKPSHTVVVKQSGSPERGYGPISNPPITYRIYK